MGLGIGLVLIILLSISRKWLLHVVDVFEISLDFVFHSVLDIFHSLVKIFYCTANSIENVCDEVRADLTRFWRRRWTNLDGKFLFKIVNRLRPQIHIEDIFHTSNSGRTPLMMLMAAVDSGG